MKSNTSPAIQTTKWGQQRAKDGHPDALHSSTTSKSATKTTSAAAPASYEYRFPAFFDAIKAKYPNIKIIATAHLKAARARFV